MPADVSCDEWAFSLLPLDVDLLSMELPEFFRDYFLVRGGPLGLDIGGGWGQAGSSGLATSTYLHRPLSLLCDSDWDIECH